MAKGTFYLYFKDKYDIRNRLITNKAGKVFERDEVILWQCRNCGFVYEGKTAPKACPACAHPQAYFEEKKNNY